MVKHVKCKQNWQKSHCVIISLSRNRIINDTDININEQIVSRVICSKFLGDLIDEKLSWASYIKSECILSNRLGEDK